MEDNLESESHEDLVAEVRRLRRMRMELSQVPRSTREHYASVVLDNMYQFVTLLDVRGTVLTSNLPVLRAGGLTFSDVVGKPFWEAHWWQVSEDIRNRLIDEIRQAYEDKKFVRYEVDVFAGKSGNEIITIDFSVNPVINENNQVMYLLAEGRNITEKKLAEAQLEQKNKELRLLYERVKELDLLKSQFIANVSHELRTPLALILGPTEKLLESQVVKHDPVLQKNLETVTMNAYTLLKHVNDLLEISKLEAGKLELNYTDVNFPQLIERICSHFELQANSRLMIFDVTVDGSWQAQVDIDKIERIVLNLLSNAFKFTPEGHRIQVAVNHSAPTDLKPRGSLEIVVEDSGPGIKEELWDSIFDRFQQGDGGATRNYGGTGLGLAIVKELTELHGGCALVDRSKELGGALLRIQLPLLAPPGTKVTLYYDKRTITNNNAGTSDIRGQISNFARQTLAELATHTTPSPSSAMTDMASQKKDKPLVLVVEDNQAMNQFIVETLADEYRVVTAFNGQEGVEQAVKYSPDCIVSDVMMPIMSGDELVAEIRSKSELDSIPIIMLTAKSDDELKVSMLRHGVQDYLGKPFNAGDLLARVGNLVIMRQTWLAMQQALSVQQRNLKELIDDISTMFNHDVAMKNLMRSQKEASSSSDDELTQFHSR